jgi:hypothetical protein
MIPKEVPTDNYSQLMREIKLFTLVFVSQDAYFHPIEGPSYFSAEKRLCVSHFILAEILTKVSLRYEVEPLK